MSDIIHFHLTSNVWLLTWSDWNWEEFDECVKTTQQGIPYTTAWRCHTAQARPGDMFFLVRQGRGVRGIMAIGTIGSYRFYDSEDGKARVNVTFNYIIDYSKENIITTESLENDCPNQMWSPRGSGISIKSEYHSYLEDRWNSLIESGGIVSFHSDTLLTKSIEQEEQLEKDLVLLGLEGSDRTALVKQRINQGAYRERLLNKYKNGCFICGAGIHLSSILVASHIKPWSESDPQEKTDVNNGLLLCPNHDKLFDGGWISFDNNGKLMISEELPENDKRLMHLDPYIDRVYELNSSAKIFMEYHRINIFRNNTRNNDRIGSHGSQSSPYGPIDISLVNVGTKLHHKRFGDGIIAELNSEFATIEFELGKKDLPIGVITNGDSFYILTD